MENELTLVDQMLVWLAEYGLRIIAALVILIVGRIVAMLARKLSRSVLARSKVDETIVSFVSNVVYFGVLAFVVIAILAKLGFQTASMVAVIGAAGLAIGLAMQGSLANFAAGVLIILFKPFKVGDFIEGGGATGIIEDISIFTTEMRSPDNKLIIVPNAGMTSNNIVNYSAKPTRRVDMVFGVGYGEKLPKVKAIIEEILAADERILADPAPVVAVLSLGDSSVDFAVRPWVKTADYWDVYFDLNMKIKMRFDQEGIAIPFPQRDVHLFTQADSGQTNGDILEKAIS